MDIRWHVNTNLKLDLDFRSIRNPDAYGVPYRANA